MNVCTTFHSNPSTTCYSKSGKKWWTHVTNFNADTVVIDLRSYSPEADLSLGTVRKAPPVNMRNLTGP